MCVSFMILCVLRVLEDGKPVPKHVEVKLKESNEMQEHADIYLLLNYSTCFGRPLRPSSGVHEPAVAASGTDRTIWGSLLPR